ncbi:S66 peptidase family protein [Amycolatopsis anabasis]|uniref:S66 peptidase family protein n=1 Tax=Amycolatopsis anabasis TaxID=1840409 RepID=UPI00131E08D3|nr:LD-carboxypeptidase [Amycolatopsis anabasis]
MRARRLAPGDLVALVAPAGPVPERLLEAAVPILESWGLRVRLGACVRSRHPSLGYLAASDADRAAEFQAAWSDPEVAAVFAARGGYGAQRMLDLVDWPALRAAGPKLLAGSSDITALHQAVSVHLGLATLFSPMPATAHFDAEAVERLRCVLFEPERSLALHRPGATALVPGAARGVLVGGNLSLLAAGIGAPEHRAPEADAIAVLEDVTEDVYRLDRMLTQLLRTGWFDRVTGIALGSWAECGDPAKVRALMVDRLAPLGVPIAWELGFGHVPRSPTIPLGVPAELDADAGTLILTEPALS